MTREKNESNLPNESYSFDHNDNEITHQENLWNYKRVDMIRDEELNKDIYVITKEKLQDYSIELTGTTNYGTWLARHLKIRRNYPDSYQRYFYLDQTGRSYIKADTAVELYKKLNSKELYFERIGKTLIDFFGFYCQAMTEDELF